MAHRNRTVKSRRPFVSCFEHRYQSRLVSPYSAPSKLTVGRTILGDITDLFYQTDDWWYVPRKKDLVLADPDSAAGKIISSYKWGDATGDPVATYNHICQDSTLWQPHLCNGAKNEPCKDFDYCKGDPHWDPPDADCGIELPIGGFGNVTARWSKVYRNKRGTFGLHSS